MNQQDRPQSLAAPQGSRLGVGGVVSPRGRGTGTRRPPPPTLQPPPLPGPRPLPREVPYLRGPSGAHRPGASVRKAKPLRPGGGGPLGGRARLCPCCPAERRCCRRPRRPVLPCLPLSPAAEATSIAAGGEREGDRGLPEAVISIPDSIGWGWCLETGPKSQDILPSQGPGEVGSFRGKGSREGGSSVRRVAEHR